MMSWGRTPDLQNRSALHCFHNPKSKIENPKCFRLTPPPVHTCNPHWGSGGWSLQSSCRIYPTGSVSRGGAGFGDGLFPRREFAVRVTAATIKGLLEPGATHHDLTRAAFFRAGNSQRFALHVFARGVIAARGELPEAAVLDHQVVAALGALLFQRLIAHCRSVTFFNNNLLSATAFGISGASQEVAKTAALHQHGLAALLAVFRGNFRGGARRWSTWRRAPAAGRWCRRSPGNRCRPETARCVPGG